MDGTPQRSKLFIIKQQLSPFGQQMLENLVKFLTTDGHRNSHDTQETITGPKYGQVRVRNLDVQSNKEQPVVEIEEETSSVINNDNHTDVVDENATKNNEDSTYINTEANHDTDENTVKQKKRLKQTKITDLLTKKVKNDKIVEKNVYRKEKYTKTVKNWLININANDFPEQSNVGDYPGIKKASDGIEKHKNVKKKVKLQTQLANKDGIMKFK